MCVHGFQTCNALDQLSKCEETFSHAIVTRMARSPGILVPVGVGMGDSVDIGASVGKVGLGSDVVSVTDVLAGG